MENPTLSKRTAAFGLAAAIACLVNAVIVVVKEKSDAVMMAMKSLLGHHWTTHAAFVIVLFLVLGWLFNRSGLELSANRLIRILVSCVALAAMIIVGFYVFVD